jgi:hypothetical protein
MKIDKRLSRRFKRSLKRLESQTIQIGATGQHADTTLSNAKLLGIFEFMVYDEEPRAPIRKTFRNNRNLVKISRNLRGLMKTHYDHRKAAFKIKKITDGLGLSMAQMVKTTIMNRVDPANAESTLRAKARKNQSDVPGIATKQMVNSITYGVRS